MEKTCTTCGLTKPLERFEPRCDGSGKRRSICYSCRNKKPSVVNRRRDRYSRMMRKAIEYLGNKCSNPSCLLSSIQLPDAAYDFHHRDPSTKKHSVCNLIAGSKWETVKEELDKCDLLCCLCHRLEHRKRD